MIFLALLLPFALLGLLLGMERLERWTLKEPDNREARARRSPLSLR